MALYPKPFVAGVVGLLAWTLSIHIMPVKLDARQSHSAQCHEDVTSQHVIQSMIDGIVTHMHHDGTVLSIEISTAWQSLSAHAQNRLYQALQCLAQHENVAFQIRPSHVNVP